MRVKLILTGPHGPSRPPLRQDYDNQESNGILLNYVSLPSCQGRIGQMEVLEETLRSSYGEMIKIIRKDIPLLILKF